MSKKRVGLALGSGGVRGLGHIGVIKTLIKNEITIDYLAGASVGAWVGAHYALYRDVEKLAELTMGMKKEKLFSFFEPSLGGFIGGEKIERLLNKWLGNADFSDLKIPFRVVAADLVSGEEVVIRQGKVAKAVRASMAIPGIFKPVIIGEKILVDGGVVNPVPDDVVREMGAEAVVAVNLNNFQEPGRFTHKDLGFASTAIRTMEIMRHYLASYSLKEADIIIAPKLAKYGSWREYFTSDIGEKIVGIAEKETEKIMPKLKEIIGEDDKQ